MTRSVRFRRAAEHDGRLRRQWLRPAEMVVRALYVLGPFSRLTRLPHVSRGRPSSPLHAAWTALGRAASSLVALGLRGTRDWFAKVGHPDGVHAADPSCAAGRHGRPIRRDHRLDAVRSADLHGRYVSDRFLCPGASSPGCRATTGGSRQSLRPTRALVALPGLRPWPARSRIPRLHGERCRPTPPPARAAYPRLGL